MSRGDNSPKHQHQHQHRTRNALYIAVTELQILTTETWKRTSTSRCIHLQTHFLNGVRFEVITAVTMKNGVLCDVAPCGSCKNRRFGGI
jgi:hypothetical protein